MHTTLCILIEISTYQRNKYGKKKVRAIIRRTATKDESYFTPYCSFKIKPESDLGLFQCSVQI